MLITWHLSRGSKILSQTSLIRNFQPISAKFTTTMTLESKWVPWQKQRIKLRKSKRWQRERLGSRWIIWLKANVYSSQLRKWINLLKLSRKMPTRWRSSKRTITGGCVPRVASWRSLVEQVSSFCSTLSPLGPFVEVQCACDLKASKISITFFTNTYQTKHFIFYKIRK